MLQFSGFNLKFDKDLMGPLTQLVSRAIFAQGSFTGTAISGCLKIKFGLSRNYGSAVQKLN